MRTRKLGLDSKKKKASKQTVLTKIPGITAPGEKKLKGWALEVGGGTTLPLCATTVNGKLYAMEGECSRCNWGLERGELRGSVSGDAAIACALCGQTYSVVTGEPGPVVEKKGAAGWVGGLARSAPTTSKPRTQKTIRADVREDDVYLDVESKLFKAALKKGAKMTSMEGATDKMKERAAAGD